MRDFILKCDFSLSNKLASSKDRVLPGVSFLFLTKLSFVVFALCAIVVRLLPFKLHMGIVVVVPVLLSLFIMYGLQGSVKGYIKSNGIDKEFAKLPEAQRKRRNLVGVLMLIAVYGLSFFVAVKMIGGYSK
jgi:hypothetical protein